MAQQAPEKEDSKVALDMEDLPLPELEEEPVEEEEEALPATGDEFDLSGLAPDEETNKRRPKLIIIGGGALLLVLLVVVWFFFLRSSGEEQPEEQVAPEVAIVTAPVGPPRATLKPFIIPVMPDPRGRLLKIIVMLEFASTDDMDMVLAESTPIIRDAIYRTLRNRSLSDINSARLNNILPMQVKDSINKALGANSVLQVYFPDFLFAG